MECYIVFSQKQALRGGAVAARWAHNPKVPSSSLGPATSKKTEPERLCFFIPVWVINGKLSPVHASGGKTRIRIVWQLGNRAEKAWRVESSL